MSIISCNVAKLTELRDKFQYLSNDLNTEIKGMNEEIINLDEILSTPKGDKLIELFTDFVTDEKNRLSKNNEIISNHFNLVIDEYSNFLNETNSVVDTNE